MLPGHVAMTRLHLVCWTKRRNILRRIRTFGRLPSRSSNEEGHSCYTDSDEPWLRRCKRGNGPGCPYASAKSIQLAYRRWRLNAMATPSTKRYRISASAGLPAILIDPHRQIRKVKQSETGSGVALSHVRHAKPNRAAIDARERYQAGDAITWQ